MPRLFRVILAMAVILGSTTLLVACHTTAGFGQDMSQGGHALSDSANANAPTNPKP